MVQMCGSDCLGGNTFLGYFWIFYGNFKTQIIFKLLIINVLSINSPLLFLDFILKLF